MFDKNLKNIFLIHASFLTIISISLFYFCKKVFIHSNIWMIGKHSMMFSHLEKNVIADITYAEYAHTKRVCKGFKIKRLIDYTTNYRYVKASNKYMKNYEKNKEPSYLK